MSESASRSSGSSLQIGSSLRIAIAAACPLAVIGFVASLSSVTAAADRLIAASLPASASWHVVHVAVLVYAMIAYLLHSSSKPASTSQPRALSFPLKLLHALHYAGLSLASLWMLAYMITITSRRVLASSSSLNPFVPDSASSWLLCEKQPTMSEDFYRLSFVYYLSKYWELLDSLFQVQKAQSLGPKGSPPSFLHYYHHAAVVVMCLNWIESNQTLQWLGLAFNTFVHVIMYAYYAFTVYKPAPRPLKMLITQARCGFRARTRRHTRFMYHIVVLEQACVGLNSLVFNVMFNVSLLFLFTQFKEKAYAAPSKAQISPVSSRDSAAPAPTAPVHVPSAQGRSGQAPAATGPAL